MGYAAVALALLGVAVGAVFRLQILLLIVGLVLLVSIAFSFANGFSFLHASLTIMGAQTILQSGYFLGTVVRAIFPPRDARHIL